jgi:hypothetical protein
MTAKFIILLGSIFALTWPASATLVNADFEEPAGVGAYNYIFAVNSDAVLGWKVIGEGTVSIHHVNGGFNVWPGNSSQFLDLTGNTGNAGIESSSFGTIPGTEYRLTFDAFNGSLVNPGSAFTGPALSVQASGASVMNISLAAGIQEVVTYTL